MLFFLAQNVVCRSSGFSVPFTVITLLCVMCSYLSSLEELIMYRPSGLPQGDTIAFVSLNNRFFFSLEPKGLCEVQDQVWLHSECVPCYRGSPFLPVSIKEEWREKGRDGNACTCPCIHKRAGRDLGCSQLCSLPVFI